MSFAFPKVEAETGVPITGRNASLTDYLGLKFTLGAGQTAGRAITGFIGDMFDDSEMLDPKTANMLYGNPDTGLVHTEPVRENRAKAMQTRHDLNAIAQAELDTMQNVGAVKGAAGFITQMVGGMSHPIDFSMNFIPFVGSAKLAKGATGPLSRAMTRGLLVSEETIAKHVTFPRLTAAVIDATAGNILAEIPVAFDARRNKEQYEAADFAANILGGAVVGGAIKGITLGIGRAREAYTRVSPEIQDRMMRDSIQQMAAGKSPDVHSHAAIDPKLMEAEWREREAAIRAEGGQTAPTGARTFETAKGSVYQVNDDGTTVRNKAARPEHPGEVGVQPPSEKTWYVTREDADKLGEIQAQGGPRATIRETPDGSGVGVFYLDGKDAGKFEARTVVPAVKDPEVGLIPVEHFGDSKTIHFGNEIVKIGKVADSASDPRYQAFVKERIDKYVAEQKKLFDVEYQKKLAVSEAARVKQGIGSLASAEDIAKLDGTRVPEAAIADMAEDARALSADAEADLKALEVDDPELAAHIRKTLKEQMDVIDSPEPKAIEAAMRCLINE